MTNTNSLSVGFTIVKSDSDIGKRFTSPDKKTIRKQVLGQLYAGTATTRTLRGATAGDLLDQLAGLVLDLPLNHVLLLGTAVNGKTENRLCTKATVGREPGAIARSKDEFAYRGELMFVLIDNDGGRGTDEILIRLWKPFGDVAMLTLPSSSSAVMLNGVAAKAGGEHTYLVLRGGRVKEVLRRLLDLCVLNGLAHIMIAANGRMLLRGPVDACVYGPERVIFPGANHVKAPVTQGPREPQLWEGDILDAERFLSETDRLLDREELKRIVDAMKAEKLGEADRKAEEWGRNRVAEAVAKGSERKRAEAQVKRIVNRIQRANKQGPGVEEREHETLEADFVITVSDGTRVTVREICADPLKYDGMRCADPFEGPSYNNSTTTAVIFAKDPGAMWIFSHAHGATTDYSLVVRELIDPADPYASMTHEQLLAEAAARGAAPKPGKDGYSARDAVERGKDAERMVRAAVASKADDTTRETLKKALEHMAGLKAAPFNRQWKQAAETRKKYADEDARAEQAAGEEADTRPEVPAPSPASPRGAVANLLDSMLAQVVADEPPMRNSEGRLLKIVEQGSAAMHELRDDFEFDEVAEGGDEPAALPAAKEPRMHVRDAGEIAVLVEQHIKLTGVTKKDYGMEVALETPFCNALDQLEGKSAMPVARGITTMPVVKVDEQGRAVLRMPAGLDRETGVIFRIPEELRSIMPKAAPTREEARQAWLWLRDRWLCDVATDEQGKATVVAMALTTIQRHDFTERPDFYVNAAKAAIGKTTAVNMVTMAVLGHRAPATAWAATAEERRKALFAIFKAGSALVCFDNIRRGTEIQDETIEKVQTARRYSDRKLGVSEHEEIDATTVLVWTGNAIRPKGDSASRNVVVPLATDDVRPGDRPVEHENPVEWTLKHRMKILGCLYTLLMVDRELVPGAQAPTRFKHWWRVIARPIEMVANVEVNTGTDTRTDEETGTETDAETAKVKVSFAETMAATEEDNTEELAIEGALRAIHEGFGEMRFRATAAAALLDAHTWQAKGIKSDRARDMVDQFVHDLVEATTGTAPVTWNTVTMGQRLKLLANRPARLEGVGEVRLKGKLDRTGVTTWRVEVLKRETHTAAE